MNANFEENYVKTLQEVNDIYVKVKETIIFGEDFDPRGKFYIAPMNQLRSALDHIFKAATSPDDYEYELKEAKEHIERAGYDAYTVLASNLGTQITQDLDEFSNECIATVFPEYYQEIAPLLGSVKINVGLLRSKKKESNYEGIDGVFEEYFQEIQKLMEIITKVKAQIPGLYAYQAKENRNEKKQSKNKKTERIWNVAIGIFVGVVIMLISTFSTKGKTQRPSKPSDLPQKEKSLTLPTDTTKMATSVGDKK